MAERPEGAGEGDESARQVGARPPGAGEPALSDRELEELGLGRLGFADPQLDDPGFDEEWDDPELNPFSGPPEGDDAWSPGGWSAGAGSRYGFGAGGVADGLEPGAVLAGLIAGVAPPGDCGPDLDVATSALAGLGESELVGVLCASRRMASWSAAMEAAAMITLARRRAEQAREQQRPSLVEHAPDEVAAALTVTSRAGRRLLEVAGGLARLRVTWAALAAGVIDWPRAVIIADDLAALDDADALTVERSVLLRAGGLTTGQLRAALRRAVLAVDPAAAGRRRRAARKDAGVQVWDEPSGNSAMAGRELPQADVIAADQRITALARWLSRRGAEGTLQQLRAAVFIALLAGRPVSALVPPGAAGSGDGSRAESERPADGLGWPVVTGTVNLTMPLSAWLGISQAPGEVAGIGPADAETCRDLADWLAAGPSGPGRPRWCLTLTDRSGHAVAHACARHGPGMAGPPRRARSPGAPPGSGVPRPDGPGPPGGPAGLRDWVASLRPVFLESGTCTHQRQTASYQPPASLRHLVTVRRRTCTAPGCRRPATACDLDHTIPFHRGGLTCECNLGPVCRHHHHAKQASGWHLDQPQPGILVWTLPHGRAYRTLPDAYPV